jgi:hypothetical protein
MGPAPGRKGFLARRQNVWSARARTTGRSSTALEGKHCQHPRQQEGSPHAPMVYASGG